MLKIVNQSDNNRCMLGSIHTEIRCQICGNILKDDKKDGLRCENHPDFAFTGKCRVHFKGIRRRFKSYFDACRFLNHLRYEVDENLFDVRKYRNNTKLGFIKLGEEFVSIKKHEVKKNSLRPINTAFRHAFNYFGNINIKAIKPKDIQLFLNSLDVSNKTKHDYSHTLKLFFRWLYINELIEKIPEFPKIQYTLRYRKTVNKDTQRAIIEEVQRISYKNPKIWLGIHLAHRYFNTRPHELRNIKECNVDLINGRIYLKDTKDKPKFIFLIPADIKLLKMFDISSDDLYLFRHKNGQQFGPKMFYRYWRKACNNLGVEGVSIYPGTRHSTVVAKRSSYSPEQIKLASGHSTNAAFNRYFQVDPDYLREIYSDDELEKGNKKGIRLAKA